MYGDAKWLCMQMTMCHILREASAAWTWLGPECPPKLCPSSRDILRLHMVIPPLFTRSYG